MRGDRHMGTNRSHNRIHVYRGSDKQPTKTQRTAALYAIGNRGK